MALDSLTSVISDNPPALECLLAESRGGCAVIDKTCRTYIHATGQIEDISKIYSQAEQLRNFAM